MIEMSETVDRAGKVLIGNYARLPIVMSHGQGAEVWDAAGKRYVDLFAGFGGAVLGHCHSDLIKAATTQAGKLWHVGNTFHTDPQIELAERLNRHAFPGKAFFCHSGLEANEAAIKLARLRGQTSSPAKWKVVSLNRSFHGRSLAMIAATGNPAVKAGFEPAVPGFTQIDMNDSAALDKACDDETCAIIAEPIQGEGGIHPLLTTFATELRKICDDRKITLIFDEVWTGCGRTGKMFGYQHLPVTPDILTLGKAIGGGLPVGVMYAKPELASLLVPGKHGCTLGGNPICMAVARTIFDVIDREDLLSFAKVQGEHAIARLRNEPKLRGKIKEVRGRALFIGAELTHEDPGLVERALARGVIVNVTAKTTIRLAPPINISREHLDEGLTMLVDAIASKP